MNKQLIIRPALALAAATLMSRSFVVTATFILTVAFVASASGQTPKEGTASGTISYSGTSKALAMREERLHMVYDMMGVLTQGPEGNFPTQAASMRCVGSMHAIKGAFDNNTGFCVHVDADGDQWFSTYQGAGQFGAPQKGTYTVVGGTGKYQGISGSGDYTSINMPPVSEDTFQLQTTYKGNWKLP